MVATRVDEKAVWDALAEVPDPEIPVISLVDLGVVREVEVDGERAGVMGFEVGNRRSRIAHLERLAVHPAFRGRRIADEAARLFQRHLFDELGYHRLQLEIYGFNERAMRHAERAGFTREGVRRKAYWRADEWVDGVLYGLVAEDLDVDS